MAARFGLQIEKELFTNYPNLKEYQDKARSLVFNLKDPRNYELREKIMCGILSPN